ncbi:efflux RND transporter permease subunit [Geothrix sp. 21YS21S-4]|uniref:efflux RND transporter permease subunit n=1 Tax=Geothrix sp. 21YS21S-4 TaxID=3068889 RepID=UPI0027BAE84D|nr:efflux RND transporter permease subunit [Geothrix sp. 21YS21S-4]
MFLSDLSIRRPVFTVCIMLALVVLGLFSVKTLGIDQYPNTDIPTVTVSVVYPGASPESVKQDVVRKIEEAVNPIEKIKEISSTSQEGLGTLVIQFHLGRNVDNALNDVRTKIGQIRRDLPSNIEEPVISKFDPAQLPVLSLVLKPDAQHASLDDRELTRIAEDFLKRRIENIPGVGKVDPVGVSTREILIQIDPQKLESQGLSLQAVNSALGSDTMAVPSGNLLQGDREVSVKVDAKARAVSDFNHVVVGNKEGRPIELQEVATVVDGIKERRSLARLGGQDVVALEIQRQTGGNTVAMVKAVEAALEELKPELKKQGVEVVTAKDNARFIIDNVDDVNVSIYVGGLLTVIIVFFFLKSWRSTLITSLTLPVSVISTFIVMRVLDFTLNTMTLMGLSLAIGILIDDAIVVRENITRHAEMGKDHVTAAREGTAEIGPAVIATTLSILAVFVPVAFMGGIVGKFFFPFGIVVAFAVAVSLFVSFTLDPMLSAVWPDPEHEKSTDGHVHYQGRNPIMRSVEAFGRMLDRWEALYKRAIEWAMEHRKTVMFLGGASFILAMALSGLLGNNFMPDYDRGDLQATFKAEPGSSVAATREKAVALEKAILAVPGVDFAYTTIGTGLNGTVDSGGIYIKLKEGRRPNQVVIRRQIRENFRSVPGVDASIGTANDWGTSFPIMVAVQAPERDAVIQAAPLVKEALRSVPGAVDVTTSLDSGKPELRLVIDRKAASDLGVSPGLVAQLVRPLVDGEKVAKFEDEKGEQRDVRVRLEDRQRRFTAQLANMTVQSTKDIGGGKHPLVRLNQVARFEEGIAPAKLQRHDLMEEVEVDANFDGSTLGEVSAGAAKKVEELKASGKLPEGVRVEFLGQTRDNKETAGYMGSALLLAVFFIYFVLASQFESFKLPIAIMASLPLSMVGMVLMLLVTGDSMSMMTSIGMILLMGLVTKNAILLVDHALHLEREEGIPRRQAIIRAGTVRLRPILMTSFAMVGGMLPLFLALGAGAEMRAPMARAVVGGLITSTLLTLIVVPVFFEIIEEMSLARGWAWIRRRLGMSVPEPAAAPPLAEAPDA